MSNNTEELRAKAKGSIAGLIIGFVAGFVFAWIFNIEGGKEYGWFAGMWHGGWAPFNWVRSLFFDGIYVKAPLHTSAYGSCWLGFCIFSILSILRQVIIAILSIRFLSKS